MTGEKDSNKKILKLENFVPLGKNKYKWVYPIIKFKACIKF